MNLDAFRLDTLRISISWAPLGPDRGLPRWAELLSKDAHRQIQGHRAVP